MPRSLVWGLVLGLCGLLLSLHLEACAPAPSSPHFAVEQRTAPAMAQQIEPWASFSVELGSYLSIIVHATEQYPHLAEELDELAVGFRCLEARTEILAHGEETEPFVILSYGWTTLGMLKKKKFKSFPWQVPAGNLLRKVITETEELL